MNTTLDNILDHILDHLAEFPGIYTVLSIIFLIAVSAGITFPFASDWRLLLNDASTLLGKIRAKIHDLHQ